MISRTATAVSWIAQVGAAAILLMAAAPKLTGDSGAAAMFDALGLGSPGRIAVGLGELAAGVLLLLPAFAWVGAGLGAGLMAGAIFFHITRLGIVVDSDGGTMFAMAVFTLVASATVLWIRRRAIPLFKPTVA